MLLMTLGIHRLVKQAMTHLQNCGLSMMCFAKLQVCAQTETKEKCCKNKKNFFFVRLGAHGSFGECDSSEASCAQEADVRSVSLRTEKGERRTQLNACAPPP